MRLVCYFDNLAIYVLFCSLLFVLLFAFDLGFGLVCWFLVVIYV